MDRDPFADMFRFRLGDGVRWAESPRHRLYVYQRRWTEREILEPVVQYRCRASKEGNTYSSFAYDWIHERDLVVWEEEP